MTNQFYGGFVMDKKYKCQLNGVEYEMKKIDELDVSYQNSQKKYKAKLVQTEGLTMDPKNCLNSQQELVPLLSKIKSIENSVLVLDEKDTPSFIQLRGDNVLTFKNTQVPHQEIDKNEYYLFEVVHTKNMVANTNLHTTHRVDKKNTVRDQEVIVQVH